MGGLSAASIGDDLQPQYRKRGAIYWSVSGSIRRADEPHASVMAKQTTATSCWAEDGWGMGQSRTLVLTGRPCPISAAEQLTAVRTLRQALVSWIGRSGAGLVSSTPGTAAGFALAYSDGPHRGTVTVAVTRQRTGVVRIDVICRERTPAGA